jgi:hypothetical protein
VRPGLAIVIATYLALAAGYNLAMPFGVPPDEGAHAFYVQSLAERGRLPRLDLSKPSNELDPAGYEAHQPPLYYALAAPVWRVMRALDVGEQTTVRVTRVVSSLIGAAGLWLLWFLARLVFGPDRTWHALAATAFAAFLPMRLAVGAALSNDSLAEAAATGTLCLLLMGLEHGFTARHSLWTGLATGAAVLAKASNLLLAPFVLAAIALDSQRASPAPPEAAPARQSPKAAPARHSPKTTRRGDSRAAFDGRRCFTHLGSALGAAAIVCGWWFVRNQALYGDMLLERTFKLKFAGALSAGGAMQLFGCPSQGSYLISLVLPVTFQTFWGAFGHLTAKDFMGLLPRHSLAVPPGLEVPVSILTLGSLPARQQPVPYPPASWLYPILAVWTWVVAIGLARGYGRTRGSAPDEARRPVLILLTYSLMVFAAFLRFNLEFFQAQGRYLFPALAPIAAGFAAGWLNWFPGKSARWGALALIVGMAALGGYALWGVILPDFAAAARGNAG